MDLRLKGKIALVTGGSSGIGYAICSLFASEGASVGVNVCHSAERGKKLIRSILDSGGNALLLKADISKVHETEEMIKKLVSEYGGIDILVNSSGIRVKKSDDRVLDIQEQDWDSVIDINLKGAMLTSKFVIPHMIKRGGGSIVNISSIRGLLGGPNLASYCASKGGLVLLTREMALDYAKYNIRVNCLCPGFIETDMFNSYLDKQSSPEETSKNFSEMAPMNKIGNPEEIAYPALFLASDAASFITGVALPVDGGYSANGVRRIL